MRRFLILATMLVTAGCIYAAPAGAVSFPDGVASGDVTSSRAILWTRADTAENYKVDGWTNASLTGPKAFKGKMKTDASRDFTLKIDVTGLTPNTQYWFRFSKDADVSDVGTFKTAPAPGQGADFEIAYTGDADGTLKPDNTPAFNNFEIMGAIDADNPDAWVFHGDTIYADSSFRPEARPRRSTSTGTRTS